MSAFLHTYIHIKFVSPHIHRRMFVFLMVSSYDCCCDCCWCSDVVFLFFSFSCVHIHLYTLTYKNISRHIHRCSDIQIYRNLMDDSKQILDGQSPHVGANIGGMLKGRRVLRRHLLWEKNKINDYKHDCVFIYTYKIMYICMFACMCEGFFGYLRFFKFVFVCLYYECKANTMKERKYWQRVGPFDVNDVEFTSRVAVGVLSHFVIFV